MGNRESGEMEAGGKTPLAGCAILIAALAVMLFLVGFSVFSLFRQFNEIAKFTDEKPAVIEIAQIEGNEAEVNRLAEKLEIFRLTVTDGESAVLELDQGEMNLAVAAYESFKDLRGTMEVIGITPEEIRLRISFRLNGKPRMSKKGEKGALASDARYLNGVLVATPGLLQKEVLLQIKEIEVDGAVVPPEFVAQMSPYRIGERYLGSEGIGEVMAGLTKVELGEGIVRFTKEKGVLPVDNVSDEQVDKMGRKVLTFFGIAASLFLLFVGIVMIVGFRLKKARGANRNADINP